jgi:hypothetical protein
MPLTVIKNELPELKCFSPDLRFRSNHPEAISWAHSSILGGKRKNYHLHLPSDVHLNFIEITQKFSSYLTGNILANWLMVFTARFMLNKNALCGGARKRMRF